LLTEDEVAATKFLKHPRPVVLTLLALAVAVASAPIILAGGAAWLDGWVDVCTVLIVVATTLKGFATTRRLRGHERTAWLFISLAFLTYALAQSTWSIYELILDIPHPLPSPADFGYLATPPLLMIGIWLYRTKTPTLSSGIVQLGNTGILVATIFLGNTIALRHHLLPLNTPGQEQLLITYAVVAMTAFLFALFNICFNMRGRRRLVMMPLLFALGSLALADYLSVYEFAAGAYTSSTYPNIGYPFAFACGYWAALEQDYARNDLMREHALLPIDEGEHKWETLLPPFTIAGLMLVAIIHPEGLTADLAPHAIGALSLFMASIALRDWWIQRTESKLIDETRTAAALLQQSEQRLLAKNEQLIAANRELSKEMIARKHVQEELRHSQKMDAIGQLTGGVAHDFNNLLAVIVGNLDLLDQTLEPGSSRRTYIQEATAAANRGAALTGRLLAFSRKQPLDPRPTDVNDLLKSMRALLERALGETIQLRFELGEDIAPCMIDGAQLENAILNLAINARDAMPGGGLITFQTSNISLDARDAAKHPDASEGDYVSIAVRDVGAGMSAQVRARVFEPFFTTKDVGAGSGLGLSMVYGFVKQSGGHVSIESNPGSGTEVRLYIPRTHLPPEPIEDSDAKAAPSGQRESVLVVEDDDALRKVIVSFLEQQNYQIAVASNGPEARAMLDESGPFDLLLSDVILPGAISGPELANTAIRGQPSIKILLMSGYASDAFDREAEPSDYTNLLQKPFSMGELARKIRFVLEAEKAADPGTD
jgi:signal transduction histidine kinase/CheY-like chemotaxis protein